MKKLFCDHCGKEINDMDDYIDNEIEFEADEYECDLCYDCFNEITDEIRNRLNEFIGGHKQ